MTLSELRLWASTSPECGVSLHSGRFTRPQLRGGSPVQVCRHVDQVVGDDPEAGVKATTMAEMWIPTMQLPWGLDALNGAVTEPAWKRKPSWYLVASDDRMIPPDAQRAMSKRAGSTVAEVKGSHAVYVSQPKAVAGLIANAARGAALAAR